MGMIFLFLVVLLLVGLLVRFFLPPGRRRDDVDVTARRPRPPWPGGGLS